METGGQGTKLTSFSSWAHSQTTFPGLLCNWVGHVTQFWPMECVDMCTTSRADPPKLLHALLCSVTPLLA